MKNEKVEGDAQREKVGKFFGDITNTQRRRCVLSNGVKNSILSPCETKHPSMSSKNANVASTNNHAPKKMTPSASKPEDKENKNLSQEFQCLARASQIVLYQGNSAIKNSPITSKDPPLKDLPGQDHPWLRGYRPIQIPRPIKIIILPPHMMKLIASARTYAQWSKYYVQAKEIKSTKGLRCVNCSKTDGKIDKVFFPCEHMCVCANCVEERQFEVCPLCKQKIKLILNHTGKEHQEYEDWLYEVRMR